MNEECEDCLNRVSICLKDRTLKIEDVDCEDFNIIEVDNGS